VILVLDSSALITLARIGRLDLLGKKRGRCCFRGLPTMPDFLGEGLKTP